MFATGALARRIEEAECSLVTDGARAVGERLGHGSVEIVPLGGGAAIFAGLGSPYTKVAGLGFAPLDDEAFARAESMLVRHGAPVQVEISTLADPSIAERLTRRGYVLRGFENVLAASLDEAPRGGWSAGLTIEMAPTDSAEWIDIVTMGFEHPDTFDGPPSHESFSSEMLRQVFMDSSRAEGFQRFIARRHGSPAGGAGLRVWKGVALLCGASTLPEHRRQGVQTALLRHRLSEAARGGCDIAVVTTQPGSKSQENVQRQGFELVYSRAILVSGGH